MTELLTAAQMRAIEQAAIQSGEVTGLELMERAGRGVVEAIFEEWPELADQRGPAPTPPEYLEKDEKAWRAVVLCGPGNNGGDGFVVARLLKERGWDLEVYLYGKADRLPNDAKENHDKWAALGAVHDMETARFTDDFNGTDQADLVVDAIFGAGLKRPVPDAIFFDSCVNDLLTENRSLAVDCPSGLDMDSGVILGGDPGDVEWGASADLTVTFHRPRLGHVLGLGPTYCGKLVVKDIGLEPSAEGRFKSSYVFEASAADSPMALDVRLRGLGRQLPSFTVANKFTHGHALVLSGGVGKTGAARLAARGALRIGAGLVTVGSPRSAMFENASQLTAIMLQQIDGAHGVSELLEDERINAVCLGPGLGRGADTQALVKAVLKEGRATVLDADALTRFELKPEVLFDMLHDKCVLTPHGGEFAKLFPDLSEKLSAKAEVGPAYSKVDAVREAAQRAGCVVVFKGADTVIADHRGGCVLSVAHYQRSAPWLATAGSGDVLAGFVTGLMSRGYPPMQAAEMGAWLHVECALEFGPGLIAEDLPEQVPAVLRRLKS